MSDEITYYFFLERRINETIVRMETKNVAVSFE